MGTSIPVVLVKCKVCSEEMSQYVYECPSCGSKNMDFFKLPRTLQGQIHVDLWVDKDVHRALMAIATRLGMTLNVAYGQAAEAFLDNLVRKGAKK